MARLNGWQRIWVLTTCAAAVWWLVLYPLRTSDTVGNDQYHQSLLRDYDSGACNSYITGPLAGLTEPVYAPDGGTCWFIYTTRTIDKIDEVPFTREKAEKARTEERLRNFGGALLIGAVALLLFSGTLYGVGALVAWVRRGFKGNVSQG